MPYMPTNMYPRNCAVEMTEDGYTFLATIDDQDYVERTELNLFDKKGNRLAFINDIDKSLQWGEASYPDVLIDVSQPPYSLNNPIVKYQLPQQIKVQTQGEENVYRLTIDKVSSGYIAHNRVNSEEYSIGSEGHKVSCVVPANGVGRQRLYVWIEISFTLTKKNNDKVDSTSTSYLTFLSYVDGSNLQKQTEEKLYQNNCSFVLLNNSNDEFVVTNTNWNLNYSYSFKKGTEDRKTYFNFSDFSIVFNLVNFKIHFIEDNKDFYLNNSFQVINNNSKVYYHEYGYSGTHDSNWKEIDKSILPQPSEWDTINVYSDVSYNQYFTDSKICYWNLRLFDKENAYKRYVGSGVYENEQIFPIEGLNNINDVKNYRIYQDIEFEILDNTFYFYWLEVCKVTQSKKGSNSYLYNIHKDGVLFDQLLSDISKTNLAVFIGTSEFNWEDTEMEITKEGDIEFTSDLNLIKDEDDDISQNIAISIERTKTNINLLTNQSKLREGDSYDIYCNFLDSNFEQFNIVNPQENVSYDIQLLNRRVIGNLFDIDMFNIKKYKLELYENNKLIFTSPYLFNKNNVYKFKTVLQPNKKYYSICYLTLENGLQKILRSSEQIYLKNEDITTKDNLLGANDDVIFLKLLNSDIDIDTKIMSIMSLRVSVYRNMYKNKVETYHDEFWGINNESIQKNNEIEESILILDNKELFPISSNNYNNTLYDYGITKGKSYDYEIYYEAEVADKCIHYFGSSSNLFISSLNYMFSPYTKQLLNFELKISESDNVFSEFVEIAPLTIKVELGETTFLNISFSEDGRVAAVVLKDNESTTNVLDCPDLSSNASIDEDSYTIQLPPIKTNIITTDDWMGISLYGTNYIYDENKENRYELNPNQVWHFDLDTKADSIDFTNERNVFVNASSIPKVGISNVNYMTQSITTKLGYLTESGEYIEDTKNRLDKFVDFCQDGTVKILRLRNGYLIPVDIAIKSNTGNYAVEGEPSDITFSWTQIGNHKDCVLYNLQQGVSY